MSAAKLENILSQCREIAEDVSFSSVRKYKEKTGRGALGYFPVYSPVEIYRAAGYLPVGLNGGGNQVEITAADSRFGSFICSIIKSTMELAMKGSLDVLDGVVFHDICDSARNLAFVVERNFRDKLFMEYIHLPQNSESPAAARFLRDEYARILKALEEKSGKKVSSEALRESIRVYNENRSLLRKLYQFRESRPQDLPTAQLYALMRSGNFIPPEEHNALMRDALAELKNRAGVVRDGIRVVVEGAFCEQPPLELLELLDAAGCFVVDDDFLLGKRWFSEDVPLDGDPLLSLAESYQKTGQSSSVRHNSKYPRTQALLDKVKRSRAQAVVFMYAKFCEPGLFDYVPYRKVLENAKIPHLFIEFEEKMWTFEKTRMELETFVESLLFEYA